MSTTSAVSTGSINRTSSFHHKRIAWAAIFAGLLVALGIQLLLSLLGMGIGMGAVNPLSGHDHMANLGIGVLLWWVITFLIALFVGGWVAGRLSRTANRFETAIHGILTWVTFVLFNVYMLTSVAGSAINTASNAAGRTNLATTQTQGSNLNTNTIPPDTRTRQTENDVASDLSKAGIYSFIGLLLGAIIAAIGSTMGRGTKYEDYDDVDINRYRNDYITPRPISPAIG